MRMSRLSAFMSARGRSFGYRPLRLLDSSSISHCGIGVWDEKVAMLADVGAREAMSSSLPGECLL